MDPLATPDDVAHALGLEDADALSESQVLRVTSLLVRVSRDFRRDAEREFTPGDTTVRLISVAGRLHLPDPVDTVDDVTSATMKDCFGADVTLDYTLDGQELLVEYNNRLLPSGVPVTIVYTHAGETPQDVVDAVAAIVARNLVIDPLSAQAQSTMLSTTDYSQRFADWVSSTKLLTEDECKTARSYRHPTPNVIIQQP